MKVKVRRLHPRAVIPSFATEGAAALDLVAVKREGQLYDTGLAFEIPQGYAMFGWKVEGAA